MFDSMNSSIDAQDALRALDLKVIGEGHAVVGETGAPFRSRERGHPLAARAAMEVHAQAGFPTAHRSPGGGDEVTDVRVALEHGFELILDGDADGEIGPGPFQ